ncbi:MAG: alpha/beta fold hydrolase [Solirubrobacterales bacterium]|nr:alpha/beta fold hydrolase [Solirubrobacterales bacterium]
MAATTSVPREGGHDGDAPGGHDRYGPEGRSAWLEVDWRRHQRWVAVEGQPVNVIELGEGPPLVFVHGLGGSWPNWLEQLPVFAHDHRVVALDLPGFGHSPKPRWKITISAYARLLEGLLEELAIPSAALVGNSMGGFISAELALASPARVERLALVSPAGISTEGYDPHLPTLRRLERILAASTGWLAAHSETVERRPRLRTATLSIVARHPAQLPAPLAAEQLRGAGKPGFLDALGAVVTYPLRERLRQIACPTLIVWGANDPLIPMRDAEVFEQLIPGARKVVLPDTGHVAMFERPALFNELLREFLGD